ncbi:MAG: NADH-quinone oxidoreductase subunit J [Acidimicrobiia bacterium]
MTAVLFFVFAAAALGGALGVILSRNPVHSALWLVVTLLSVAVFFLLQDAELVAAVQVIVYAGAIVVLFLFVIMLLGVDREETLSDPVRLQRPAAIALGALVLAEVVFLAGHEWATGASTGHGVPISGPDLQGKDLGNNIERVARVLFTDFLWPFQITAALLVVAVVGAIVLARRSGERPDQETASEPSDRAVGTLRRPQRGGRPGEVERPGPQGQERER